jgi:NADPH2:quinone reductase
MTSFVELCPVRTEAVPIPDEPLDLPLDDMRAVAMRRVGGPEVLELMRVPVPRPKAGEVLVEICARGVNFSDTEVRRARHGRIPVPWVLGNEGAGVVVALGPDVDPAWGGRRVAFYTSSPGTSGTYAEFATCPASDLIPLPDALDDIIAAAIPQQGLTAWFLVHRAARLRAGQTVLIHAAAGGVGLLAVQLARRAGARVLGTISGEVKARAVTMAGGEPLLYGDDLAERVRERTDGRGVDVVLDSVGLPTQSASMASLAPFGELVFFGDAGGVPAPVYPEVLYRRSLKVSAFRLDNALDPDSLEHARHDLIVGAVDGALRFHIDRTLPLARAAEAHRLLESRHTIGKIVLTR